MLRKAVIPTRAGRTTKSRNPGQRQRAGRAGIVPGRHARPRRHGIGIDAPVGDLVEHVRVQVDQARGHDLPVRVDHASGRLRRDVAVDRRDPVALDRDVQAALAPAARIHDLTTANQHVESHHYLPVGISDALTNPSIEPATSASNTSAPSSSEQVLVGRRNAPGCSASSSTARAKSAFV